MTQTNTGTELATRPAARQPLSLMPVQSIDQAVGRYNQLVDFARKVMKEGRDYGVIPGTERKRGGNRDDGVPDSKNNTLLKPGAEKLCSLFGLIPSFEDYRVVEDWDKGFFYYAYKCNLYYGGELAGSGIGSCNSREKKYRRASRVCPECGASTIKRSKYPPKGRQNDPPGWFCEARNGGCGRSFAPDDERIGDQRAVVDPDEACDLVNTLQKMAQKRALVAATLIATNASEFFTQDVEDMGIIEGEIVEPTHEEPDLSDDDTFRTEFARALVDRGMTEADADRRLSKILDFHKTTLDDVDLKGRRELLWKAQNGKYDDKKGKAPSAQEQPPPQAVEGSAPADEEPESGPVVVAADATEAWIEDLAAKRAPREMSRTEAIARFHSWLRVNTSKAWKKLHQQEKQRVVDALLSDEFPWELTAAA